MIKFKHKSSIVIFVLICTLVFSAFSLFVANVLTLSFTKSQNKKIEAVYTFNSNTGLKNTDSNYTSNTEFKITSEIGLIGFCKSIANYCGFEGKNVYLEKDLNMKDYNWLPEGSFRGTFDGKYHTIKNLKGTITDDDDRHQRFGLFANLETKEKDVTVKNVRISNISFISTSDRRISDSFSIAGIAGGVQTFSSNKVFIENCIVENIEATVQSEVSDSSKWAHHFFGGIVARSYHNIQTETEALLNIKNCLVNGVDFSAPIKNKTHIAILTPAGSYVTTADGEWYNYSCNIYSVTDCVSKYDGDYDNYLDYSSAGDNYPHDYHIQELEVYKFSSSETYKGLKKSSEGGDKDAYPWLRNKEYLGGLPYLRKFLTWKDINFYVDPPNGGSLTVNKIKVPDDFIKRYDPTPSDANLYIFDTYVYAQPSNSKIYSYNWAANNGSCWTCESVTQYTAHFKAEGYSITFVDASNATESGLGTYVLNPDSATITVSTTQFRTGIYKSVTFKFKDVENKDCTVTYTTSNTHYISGHNLTNTTLTGNVTGITVTTELRNHSITFK